MKEEFIKNKLVIIENQLNEVKRLIVEMNTDATTTFSLQDKLKEANDRIRNLEYENWILKNPDKVSSTANIKEKQQ